MDNNAKYENLMIDKVVMDIKAIKESLDKIVELLTIINKWAFRPYYYYRIPTTISPSAENSWDLLCNYGDNKYGQLTGGWYCPVHGQVF